MKVVGVLLAGGLSRRFGKQKAFALYKDKYLYEWAKDAMKQQVNEIVIVSHPSLKQQFQKNGESNIVEDLPAIQGRGPLAGIYTAMELYEADWYIVLPCDTPKINDEIIGKMKLFTREDTDALVPVIKGKVQPLIAIYHKRVKMKIEEVLTSGQNSMKSLLAQCNVKLLTEETLSVQGNEFDNINDQAAFRELIKQEFYEPNRF